MRHYGSSNRKTFVLEKLASIKPDLEASWIIKRLLPAEGVCFVYGSPGSGKSFLALHMAICIASGQQFAGQIVKSRPVVYISAEGGAGFRKRVIAVRDELQISEDVPFNLITVAPNLGTTNGDVDALIEAINAELTKSEYTNCVVFLDTVSRCIPGIDENLSKDMNTFIYNLDQISKRLGNSLIVGIHHPGKNSDNGLRGSSALLGAADSVIQISNDEAGLRTALIQKQKDDEDSLSFTFRLSAIEIGKDEDDDAITTCVLAELSDLNSRGGSQQKQRRLPAGLQFFLEAFETTLIERGKMIRPFNDGPEVKAVSKEALREVYYSRRIDDLEATKRKGFNDNLKAATERRLIFAGTINGIGMLWS